MLGTEALDVAAHRDSLQALFTRLSAALQAVVGQEAFQGPSGRAKLS